MSIGKNTRKPVAAASAMPRTIDNPKSDIQLLSRVARSLRIKQRFRTPSQCRRSEPSPTPPKTLLVLWRGEHLRRPLLPRLHPKAQESLKTQQTLSGQLHRSAI